MVHCLCSSACQVVPLLFVPTISSSAWSFETYITEESPFSDTPLHTFPEHEYVPIFPAWQVSILLAGWFKMCMVEFTHFVPSGKK